MAGKIKFVGFDSDEKLVDALKSGKLQGTVVQNPVKMGYLAVRTMAEHLKGQKVDRRIDTGAVLVTPENMEEPGIKALLHPERVQ